MSSFSMDNQMISLFNVMLERQNRPKWDDTFVKDGHYVRYSTCYIGMPMGMGYETCELQYWTDDGEVETDIIERQGDDTDEARQYHESRVVSMKKKGYVAVTIDMLSDRARSALGL